MAERTSYYKIEVVGDAQSKSRLGEIELEIKKLTAANKDLKSSIDKNSTDFKTNSVEIGKNAAQIKNLTNEKGNW